MMKAGMHPRSTPANKVRMSLRARREKMPSDSENHVYTRHIPHWRAANATYFVTWRRAPCQHALNPDERRLTFDTILHFAGERYEAMACVVIEDHVHVIVQPYR